MALSDTSGSLQRFVGEVFLTSHEATEPRREGDPPLSPLVKGEALRSLALAVLIGGQCPPYVFVASWLCGFVAVLVRSLALAALMAIG